MKVLFAIGVIGAIVMAAGLVYGFAAGDGWTEVRTLAEYPWFIVSIIDVYIGFILFACWIALRERLLPAVVWIILLMTLGNLVACVYLAIAAIQASRGTKALLPAKHR